MDKKYQKNLINDTVIKIKDKKKKQKIINPKTQEIRELLHECARNVWSFLYEKRSDDAIEHGATFSESLVSRLIYLYTYDETDWILDPFIGIGTTLKVCQHMQRNCIGIELNPEYFTKYIQPLLDQTAIVENKLKYLGYNDDCRNLLWYCEEESIQLIVTSPPYANFIQKSIADRKDRSEEYLVFKESYIKPYSDESNTLDFGNLEYPIFLEEFKKLFELFYKVLKWDGYCVLIVKNFRLMENNIGYLPFSDDLAKKAIEVGFFYQDNITEDQNENRKLQLNGSRRIFYTNINTNIIIVLRKRKPDKIRND